MGMHRTTCKTLSILLGIFINLSQKGFCLPQESQDENQQGNSTEFHDIEDGGLGHGEGMKDISSKIESEDQLEDAMKEGADQTEQESETPDIKEEEDGIEMSEDFDGKLHDPDSKDPDDSDDEDDDSESEELDKQMGDVESKQPDNLNEKMWGSDSEDEDDDLSEDEANIGDSSQKSSELAAKDEREGRDNTKTKKERNSQPNEDEVKNEEEYDGEHVDPLINKPPDDEPEIMELPNEMNLGEEEVDDVDDEVEGNQNELDIDAMKESDEQGEEKKEEDRENMDGGLSDIEEIEPEPAEELVDHDEDEGGNINEICPEDADNESSVKEEEHKNEQALPSRNEVTEPEALAAEDVTKYSSNDNVTAVEDVTDWEGGGGEKEEQHKEGQADSRNSENHEMGHKGNKTTAPHTLAENDKEHRQHLKHADEKRTLGSDQERHLEKLHIAEQKKFSKTKENSGISKSDLYEHIQDTEKGDCEAMDIATEEQALSQPVPSQERQEEDSDVEEVEDDDDDIAIDSDEEEMEEEEEDETEEITGRAFRGRSRRGGSQEDSEDEEDEIDEEEEEEENDGDSDISGEYVATLGASRGPSSTIHTQHDLWTALCLPDVEKGRKEVEQYLENLNHGQKEGVALDSRVVQALWQKCEENVSPLVHELCEQLRLVLEPTKMTKLKGDYRSGKRLNMRKIIPYIASQFRKDKIWLRRTKPSKRQYQIMLAIDDSSSMTDNHSKQLAFESLALIGKSLSLLEAGELSVVSFGEDIKLLNSFSEPFTDSVGVRILQELTFSQSMTRYSQLLSYATETMAQSTASNCSQLISKEIAQLLVIISDGQGVFGEGKELVISAVRKARDNNVFMIFVVLDNSEKQHSILDIKCPIFSEKNNDVLGFESYMAKFPFPFYILLREINSLPLVLGEALRKWFELVTSVDR